MLLVTFSSGDNRPRLGVQQDDRVIDVSAAGATLAEVVRTGTDAIAALLSGPLISNVGQCDRSTSTLPVRSAVCG